MQIDWCFKNRLELNRNRFVYFNKITKRNVYLLYLDLFCQDIPFFLRGWQQFYEKKKSTPIHIHTLSINFLLLLLHSFWFLFPFIKHFRCFRHTISLLLSYCCWWCFSISSCLFLVLLLSDWYSVLKNFGGAENYIIKTTENNSFL